MRKILLAAATLAMFALPAYAFRCPKDMAKIDEAMKTAQLNDADKAKVMEYRQKGEEFHKAGKHQESVDTLAKALEILGIKSQ